MKKILLLLCLLISINTLAQKTLVLEGKVKAKQKVFFNTCDTCSFTMYTIQEPCGTLYWVQLEDGLEKLKMGYRIKVEYVVTSKKITIYNGNNIPVKHNILLITKIN